MANDMLEIINTSALDSLFSMKFLLYSDVLEFDLATPDALQKFKV